MIKTKTNDSKLKNEGFFFAFQINKNGERNIPRANAIDEYFQFENQTN